MAARKKTARKKRATTKAVAAPKSNALALPADLQDEFAVHVNRDKATATSAGWPYISTQGSTEIMTLNDAAIGDPGIDAVILGGNRINMYYEGGFQPGVFRPATCFAVASLDWDASEIDEKMAPPADLPSRMSDKCSTCPMNAFGSAEQGRGKACKNTVRLALLLEGADYAKAEGVMLSIPPTSLKPWTQYVSQFTAVNRPIGTIRSRITKVPNQAGAGFMLRFEPIEPVSDHGELRALLGRMNGDAKVALEQHPPVIGEEDAQPQRGPRRQKVQRKSRARSRA